MSKRPVVLWDEREPFQSPQRPVPVSVLFMAALREKRAQTACAQRNMTSYPTLARCDDGTFRWLFLPARPPMQEDAEGQP